MKTGWEGQQWGRAGKERKESREGWEWSKLVWHRHFIDTSLHFIVLNMHYVFIYSSVCSVRIYGDLGTPRCLCWPEDILQGSLLLPSMPGLGKELRSSSLAAEPVQIFLTLFKPWSGEFTIFSMVSHLINISVITGGSLVSSGLAVEIFVFTNNHTLFCMMHASCPLTFLLGHISQTSGWV